MSILSAIGNTPLVELNNLVANPRIKAFAKLEGSNPGGSIWRWLERAPRAQ